MTQRAINRIRRSVHLTERIKKQAVATGPTCGPAPTAPIPIFFDMDNELLEATTVEDNSSGRE